MASTATRRKVMPCDTIPASLLPLPTTPKGSLKLGPGLQHEVPSTITANITGTLHIDRKKHAIWVENNKGRYLPQPQDLVLARVHHSASEHYHCTITPHNVYALLPYLAFENATKKTRPQLAAGALVYARVTSSLAHNKFQEPEIACFNASTGKSEGLGELKGGMVFDVSLRMVRQLLVPKRKPGNEGMSIKGISLSRDVAVLELLGKKMAFEVAVGRNGRIWVDAGSIRKTLLVGKALQETDEGHLNRQRQEMLVKRLLRETT